MNDSGYFNITFPWGTFLLKIIVFTLKIIVSFIDYLALLRVDLNVSARKVASKSLFERARKVASYE